MIAWLGGNADNCFDKERKSLRALPREGQLCEQIFQGQVIIIFLTLICYY